MKTALTPQESAANILQCRMSWPLAEKCAAELAEAGLPSIDRAQAIAILRRHITGFRAQDRAEGRALDLVRAGLIAEPLYGVRWENGDIEPAGTRSLAECLGGMFDGVPTYTTEWGQRALMASSDAGTTWTEVTP